MPEKIFDSIQQSVIDFNDGYALVLAAPGCGKTEVLSQRILKAHSDYHVSYDDMLCITFTNRASREMKDRIQSRVGDVLADLFVGNLHRFCINFLYANEIVPIDTGIIDDTDQAEFFAGMFGVDIDRLRPFEVANVINCASYITESQLGLPLEIQIHKERVEAISSGQEVIHNNALAYINYKKDNNLIDFDDLIILTAKALLSPSYREDYVMSCYHWIQVDEIQDLNPLQMAIIDHLTAPDDFCVVYLGDQRQSIYSFLGAKAESVSRLRKRCGDNFFVFSSNYRSPAYILDMLNDYASQVLSVDPSLLPHSANEVTNDLGLTYACMGLAEDQHRAIISMASQFNSDFPGESIGVLVSTNNEAELLSSKLVDNNLPNMLVARKDVFKSVNFKTIYSHFVVVANETRFSEWPRLLFQTRCLDSLSDARRCVHKMRSLGISPVDLMRYEGSTYCIEFAKTFRDKEFVIFDTETTGLDIFSDDIIQIAAIKVRNGNIVPGSELDIIIRTDKAIPSRLGRIANPMVDEYARRSNGHADSPYQHFMQPDEAFRFFLDYVGSCELLGHNANFDVNILRYNILRRSPHISFEVPVFWDSLKLSRLINPQLTKHKLESLLEIFGLEGVNSHNALDDIRATFSLVQHLYKEVCDRAWQQNDFVKHPVMLKIRHRLKCNYEPLYLHTSDMLYSDVSDNEHSLCSEFRYAYDYFIADKCIEPIDRFDYLEALFAKVLIDPSRDRFFYHQIFNHLNEMRTFNEADFYQNGIINENIHVMTIHKAKGLEFDNVIIYNVTNGTFPSSRQAVSTKQSLESARCLYVAISRARRRVFFTSGIYVSPFVMPVLSHFTDLTAKFK